MINGISTEQNWKGIKIKALKEIIIEEYHFKEKIIGECFCTIEIWVIL